MYYKCLPSATRQRMRMAQRNIWCMMMKVLVSKLPFQNNVVKWKSENCCVTRGGWVFSLVSFRLCSNRKPQKWWSDQVNLFPFLPFPSRFRCIGAVFQRWKMILAESIIGRSSYRQVVVFLLAVAVSDLHKSKNWNGAICM